MTIKRASLIKRSGSSFYKILVALLVSFFSLASLGWQPALADDGDPNLILKTSNGLIRDGSVIASGSSVTVSVGGDLQPGTGSRELRIDLPAGVEYQSGGVTAPEGWTVEYSIDGGTTWLNSEPSPASGVNSVRATIASLTAGSVANSSQVYNRSLVSNLPASTFGASTGGDGWNVFFYDNYVLNIFHHNSQAIKLDCHLRSAAGGLSGGARCAGYNPTDSDPSDGTGSQFTGYQAGNRSGGWVNGSTGKMYAFTIKNSVNRAGVLCVNLDVVPPSACGFTELSSDTVADYDFLSNAEGIGGRLFGLDINNGKLLCFDPTGAGGACANSPVELSKSTSSAEKFHVYDFGGRVYASTDSHMYCFDPANLTPCAGAWPVSFSSLSWSSGVDAPPVAHMNAAGDINGMCLPAGCVDVSGAAKTGPGWVNPFSIVSFDLQWDGYYGKYEATAGRAFIHDVLGANIVSCFDYATEAACANFDTSPYEDNSGYYVYALDADPNNPNCIFWNSDPGNIGLFDATSGAPSCSSNPIMTVQPSQFAPRVVCTTSGGIDRWSNLTLTAVNGGGTATAIKFTVRTSDGSAIPGYVDVPITIGTPIDLSGLAVAVSGARPSFNVSFTGVTGSITSADFDISYDGRGPEMCLNTVLNNASVSGSPNCPVIATIIGRMSQNVTAATTGTALSRTFTISGSSSECPESISYAGAPGSPTDVSCGKSGSSLTLNYKAPTDNGGSPIRWYEASFDSGNTWTVLNPTVSGAILTQTLSMSTANVTTCKVRAVNLLGTGSEGVASAETPATPTTPSLPATGSNFVGVPLAAWVVLASGLFVAGLRRTARRI